MGGSPRATKPGKPVNWDWEPLSLRAISSDRARVGGGSPELLAAQPSTCYFLFIQGYQHVI